MSLYYEPDPANDDDPPLLPPILTPIAVFLLKLFQLLLKVMQELFFIQKI